MKLSTGEGSAQMKDNDPSRPFEDHGTSKGPRTTAAKALSEVTLGCMRKFSVFYMM
jgi:hypothetical protein